MCNLRDDAMRIIHESIKAVLPDAAVTRALNNKKFTTDVVLVAIGKASWNMARAAKETLGSKIKRGIVITKYHHSGGPIESCEIIEAGHPLPDKNSVLGATKVLEMASQLTPDDQVVFLISGGGSSLFEKPLDGVSLEDIADLTNQLLGCGADIVEINTIRKHLSAVKGGRFALQCNGAKIYTIILSDVVGDKLDAIASGPASPDGTTSVDALQILRKYNIKVENHLVEALGQETPKTIANCETVVTGNVEALCQAAAKNAEKLGYSSLIFSTSVACEAREMGGILASKVKELKSGSHDEFLPKPPCAFIYGGETVVRLMGSGKGGRNQEVALAAAMGIEGIENAIVFSFGSDGTDGPTDAAGGMVDGQTAARIRAGSIVPEESLTNNDSYNSLKISGDLIVTGPTGTNVNDLMVVLCK
ncbi:MAG: glycerate kinase [Prolixibacteraceae bacterium]